MRIAFLGQKGLPAHWGGVEAHVEALATRLAARGHEVTAYVRDWWDAAGSEHLDGVALPRLPSLRTKHFDAATHSALAALDTLRRGYDIVHIHSLGPALFAALPRLSGSAVVVTIHALDYRREKWGAAARLALRLGEQLALRAAHRTLVVSRGLRDHYAARGRATTYLPNGVDCLPLRPPAQLLELGLAGGDYWLFLGRFVESKGVVELIEGYRQLAGPRPKLVLAGGDPAGGAYVERVQRAARGCRDILLPGLVRGELKAELFSNAAAFVSGATLEGLPIALLEAMSYGRPCLVSPLREHEEALGGGGAGLLLPMSDAREVRLALARLQRLTPAEGRAMGEAGRDRVRAEYDWGRIVDRLESLYRDLLTRP